MNSILVVAAGIAIVAIGIVLIGKAAWDFLKGVFKED
jgi:hypothetical protein